MEPDLRLHRVDRAGDVAGSDLAVPESRAGAIEDVCPSHVARPSAPSRVGAGGSLSDAGPNAGATLVDAGAVARAIGVSPGSIFRHARAGRLPHVRLGRTVRFDLAAVIASLAGAPVPVPTAPRPRVRHPVGGRGGDRGTGRSDPSPRAPAPPRLDSHLDRVRAAERATRILG